MKVRESGMPMSNAGTRCSTFPTRKTPCSGRHIPFFRRAAKLASFTGTTTRTHPAARRWKSGRAPNSAGSGWVWRGLIWLYPCCLCRRTTTVWQARSPAGADSTGGGMNSIIPTRLAPADDRGSLLNGRPLSIPR